jgi:hypothetical protein
VVVSRRTRPRPRQLGDLDDPGDRSHAEEVAAAGVVDAGVALCDEQDEVIEVLRLLQRGDRALSADEDRKDDIRKEDEVPQRHDGKAFGDFDRVFGPDEDGHQPWEPVVGIRWPAPPRGHPGLARSERGTMTRRSRATARKRDAAMARNPPAPNGMKDISLQDRGLRWHGPTHALCARVPPVVGAPRRSYGYGVVAPRPTASPRVPLWGRGTVTRAIVFLPQAPRGRRVIRILAERCGVCNTRPDRSRRSLDHDPHERG